MIVTTYSCDRCDHNQTTNQQMWEVGVHLRHCEGTTHSTQHKALWCRKCVEAVGIFPSPLQKRGEDQTPPPAPTLEDMLREMIREEIGETVRA